MSTATQSAPATSNAAPKQTRKPSAGKPSVPPVVQSGAPGDTLPPLSTVPPVKLAEKPSARGTLESDALLAKVHKLIADAADLGTEAVTATFQALGRSTNELGRPMVAETILVQMVMASRQSATFHHRSQLAATANRAVQMGRKPCFVVKSKAGTNDGSATYKLNMPTQMDVNVA